jgi:hypothetical protein
MPAFRHDAAVFDIYVSSAAQRLQAPMLFSCWPLFDDVTLYGFSPPPPSAMPPFQLPSAADIIATMMPPLRWLLFDATAADATITPLRC